MRTEDSLVRTPPPPPSVRPSRHDTPRVAGMSRADAYIFVVQENRVVLAYVYSLANSDRYRIVGCCNRLERVRRGRPTFYPLGFPEPHYILPCTTVRRHTPNQSRFCQSRALRRHRSLLHPVHWRTGQQVSGTTCPCDSVRKRANKVFRKRPAQLLSSSSSRLDFLDDLRVRGRLVSNVVLFELLPSLLKLLPSLLQRLLPLQPFGACGVF